MTASQEDVRRPHRLRPLLALCPLSLAAAVVAIAAWPVGAATTVTGLTIPDSPLITDSTIAPNLLFVLDDSGSMSYEYMPDDVPAISTSVTTSTLSCGNYVNSTAIGYMGCSAYPRNTLYYNPATTYYPWTLPASDSTTTYRMSGGTSYSAAYADTMFVPYSGTGPAGSGTITTTSTTTDLSSSVRTFYVPKDTTQTANSYLSLATNYYRYQILTSGTIYRSEYATYTSSNTPSTTSSGTLKAGVTASGKSFSTAYTLAIPANVTTVTFTASGANNSSFTLYAKSGSAVSNTNNSGAACSASGSTSSTSCSVSSPASGSVYYVNIYATSNNTSISGVTLSYSYTVSTAATGGCDTSTGTTTYGWRNCSATLPNTSRTTAEELANYATWYSYYRTRTKAAKAGASAAFAEMDGSVRVGYRTINSRGACGGSTSYSNGSTGTCKTTYSSAYNLPTQDVPIPVNYNNGVFSDTGSGSSTTAFNNRTQWYNRLFSTVPSGNTPLRGALQTAGYYFSDLTTSGGANSTTQSGNGAYGPETGSDQYACRQNFTILTTDGYWNEDSYSNSTIGNSDSVSGTTYTSSSGVSAGYTAENPYIGGLAKNSSNGSASYPTLADVANYYWKNDLRTDLSNIVPTSTTLSSTNTPDPAFWQHMVTFTIGLGLSGTVNESSVYGVLKQGYATYTSGTTTATGWPTPVNNSSTTIDDLLHAAVNGHGTYVAANDPDAFATGLRNALAAVTERTGSFSNVISQSTSASSSNSLFFSNYVSGVWTGKLYACAATDSSCVSPLWTTADTLASQYSGTSTTSIAGRGIYTCGILGSDGTCTGSTFPTTAQQTTLGGVDVTNYLRGLQTKELLNGGTLRNRSTVLGDIVDSSPTYVSATNTIYVGANDGMLHAFNAATGAELFAYVPASVVGSDLASLASTTYAHRYFVDGPITVSTTAQTASKNILVGALGRGGKGLYGLDVTTPASFGASSVLWEQTETTGTTGNMGKILGQPFIAKLNNGVTALVTGNGINSTNGHAVLLIYNALTGALIKQIDTGVGGTTAATTNGLNAPTGWDDDSSGTTDYVYASDLRGHVWKFDLSSTSSSSWGLSNSSEPLFTATYTSGTTSTAQPITSGVLVAENPSTGATWAFVGTGKYLETSDITDTSVQTLYGFIDATSSSTSTTLTPGDLTARSMYAISTTSGGVTTTQRYFNDYDSAGLTKGWYINLVVSGGTAQGERIISTPQASGTYLVFNTIIPSETTGCSSSGTSWELSLDMFTGTAGSSSYFDLDGDGVGDTTSNGKVLGGVSVSTGIASLAALLNGKLVVSDSSGALTSVGTTAISSARTSWREVLQED